MKVITFGEIMLRFAPEGYKRFVQSEKFNVTFGGAEANVSVALANWGLDTAFISKLPSHEIGQLAVNSLRHYGVDTGKIVRGGYRIGTYYCEKGASQRTSKVIYDRANSAFALSEFEEYDFDSVLQPGNILHLSGITPALGESMRLITMRLLKMAKERGVKVSFDLNYRSKLWTMEEAGKVIKEILPYVDIFIANENQIDQILGINAPHIKVENDEYSPETNIYMAEKLREKYGFEYIAITARRTVSSDENYFRGMLSTKENNYFSKNYLIRMIDRVGGGDSFDSGLLYAIINGYDHQKALDFAVASSVLKHAIEGDYNVVSVEEIHQLIDGGGTGRVQR